MRRDCQSYYLGWNLVEPDLRLFAEQDWTPYDRALVQIKGKTWRTRSNPISCYHVNGSSVVTKNMSEWAQQGHVEKEESRWKDMLEKGCSCVRGWGKPFNFNICDKNLGTIKPGFTSLLQSKSNYFIEKKISDSAVRGWRAPSPKHTGGESS